MGTRTIVALSVLLLTIPVSFAATQKVLYTFTGGADGGQPYAGVVFDSAGNLYGVTQFGGLYGQGTVFQLTPSPDGTWTETVLYNFTGGADGAMPVGGLGIDGSGNLYGSAINGGDPSAQCGTLFRLSPSESGWTFSVTHTYLGAPQDGCAPASNDTTVAGGENNQGAGWGDHGLYSFGGSGGSQPWGDTNWDYGTAFSGGAHGLGTLYYLKFYCPDSSPEQKCRKSVVPIHAFAGGKNGAHPLGNLLAFKYGTLIYGTATVGGVANHGIVYQMSQKPTGGWKFSAMYRFSGHDGDSPSAGVIADASGNFYGTTTWGGSDPGYDGTVFKLTPGVNKHGKPIWNLTTLYNFTGGADGGEIYSGVIFDDAGNLYGTTVSGGAYNQGVVYEIIP